MKEEFKNYTDAVRKLPKNGDWERKFYPQCECDQFRCEIMKCTKGRWIQEKGQGIVKMDTDSQIGQCPVKRD